MKPPSFGRVFLTAVALVSIAACSAGQLPQPQDETVASVTTARPTATIFWPSAAPASTPSPAPLITATPPPTAMIFVPTPSPAPVVAIVEFGHNNTSGGTLQDLDDTFELGENIAWKVTLSGASATETVEVLVIDTSTGSTVASGTFEPEDIHFGQQTDMVDDPGTYLMQFFAHGALVGEGQFTVTEAAATPTPKPTADNSCDPSYPTLCLRSSPDLDCGDINARDFPVRGNDPHRFDGDNDGIGCESGGGGPQPTKKPRGGGGGGGGGNCDPSYPTLCLPSSPDLDCGEINARNFPVVGRDPHGFDGDNDGIGCES